MEEKKPKVCEECEESPATVLCSECCACYCDRCSEFHHGLSKNRGHRVEVIPENVPVNGKCPHHKGVPLDRFCVDEAELCCVKCEREGLHKGCTVAKVADIVQDGKIFSVSRAKSEFTQDMRRSDELIKRVEDEIEALDTKVEEMREKIRQTFEEEYRKLNDEENRIMEKLEKVVNKHEDALVKCLNDMQKVYEHSELLSKARIGEDESSRMMALCVVSEMEKQRRRMEDFHKTEMADLEIEWDKEKRELSFARHLFNGTPAPFNIKFPRVVGKDVGIWWECDEDRMCEEDKAELRYVVEMKKKEEGKWRKVYFGKDRACTVAGLDMGTEYEVRIKAVVAGKRMEGRWSENALVRTPDVPVPSNVRVKNNSLRSITFTWGAVDVATSYQVEVDGSRLPCPSTTSTFTMNELAPDTEHRIRVRAVCGKAVSKWSGVLKGRTQNVPEFSECVWERCPGFVEENRKYSVDAKNPRIATKVGDDCSYCIIIGNKPLPLNNVISWSIKVLKSKYKNGCGIHVGVASSDIDQNGGNLYKGWYFGCWSSKLWSGPPHNYCFKEYGLRKGDGKYVHTGDSDGVVMDTAKGELSFMLNGMNCGVAYGGIPLDKPLVPCVLLQYSGDSVEFKANLDMKQKSIDRVIRFGIFLKNCSFYLLDLLKDFSLYLLGFLNKNKIIILKYLFALFIVVLIELVLCLVVNPSWVGKIVISFLVLISIL